MENEPQPGIYNTTISDEESVEETAEKKTPTKVIYLALLIIVLAILIAWYYFLRSSLTDHNPGTQIESIETPQPSYQERLRVLNSLGSPATSSVSLTERSSDLESLTAAEGSTTSAPVVPVSDREKFIKSLSTNSGN